MNNKNSIIILCKNIKLDRSHQVALNYSEEQMVNLCYDNEIGHRDNYSFIKHGKNEIEVDFSYAECLQANYIAFQNKDYSNKWFFAFVDDIEYRNNGVTRISFTIDNFATWFSYWNPSSCYVLREHVNDDTIGIHTIPEGLEFGDYIINEGNDVSNKMKLCYICVAVTWVPDNTPVLNYEGRIYNNIYSGNLLLLFRNADDCTRFIKCYDKMARAEAITNIYMVPMLATGVSPDDNPNVWKTYTYDNITTEFAILPYSLGVADIEQGLIFSNVSSLNGYVPKNNKLKVFPYCFLSITNNNGTQIDFHYEDFINNTPTFDIIGNVTAGSQTMLIPRNYKLNSGVSGYDIFYNYGIAGGKFPTCSWNTDPYINWLTENGVNVMGHIIDAPTSQAIGGSIEALLGGLSISQIDPKTGDAGVSGQGTSQISSGISKMLGAVQEQWRHSLQSPTLNGQISSGDISFSNGNTCFTYYKMSIRQEYAKIIDDWFCRFGYKINRIKVPNITGRQYYNYVQIGGSEDIVNSIGGIPAIAIEEINSMFRNGITIWHDHNNIGNYDLNNIII